MKITLISLIVDDQERALAFYRDILGFVEKKNFPAGGARWITLASPELPDGVEISLEPAGWPFVRDYQQALKNSGIPLTAFMVPDIEAEHRRLTDLGVTFKGPPTRAPGAPAMATFDDTVGNWIMLYEEGAM